MTSARHFDDDGAARGNAFAVKRAGSEAADHRPVIYHGDLRRRDLLAEFSGKKRCPAINRISIHAFKDVAENRICDQRIKNNRHVLGLHLARSQPSKCALGRDFAYMLGRLQSLKVARNRKPIIALHAAFFILRNRNRGN